MALSKLKKGDTVILHMFTGIAVGVKEIVTADKKTVTLETRAGMAKFSRDTGKQIEPPAKKERFANYITDDDGSFDPSATGRKKKAKPDKKVKKPAPKKKSKPVEEDFDEDDYEEE